MVLAKNSAIRTTSERMLRRTQKFSRKGWNMYIPKAYFFPPVAKIFEPRMRAIVEVAGLAERVVAAHCHGKPGIMAAVQPGVRAIEHGSYLDDEACDAMRETGAILVPTRTIIEDILAHLETARRPYGHCSSHRHGRRRARPGSWQRRR